MGLRQRPPAGPSSGRRRPDASYATSLIALAREYVAERTALHVLVLTSQRRWIGSGRSAGRGGRSPAIAASNPHLGGDVLLDDACATASRRRRFASWHVSPTTFRSGGFVHMTV